MFDATGKTGDEYKPWIVNLEAFHLPAFPLPEGDTWELLHVQNSEGAPIIQISGEHNDVTVHWDRLNAALSLECLDANSLAFLVLAKKIAQGKFTSIGEVPAP